PCLCCSLPSLLLPCSRSLLFTAPVSSALSSLSLHDALPISLATLTSSSPGVLGVRARSASCRLMSSQFFPPSPALPLIRTSVQTDRKSTRLNSSHVSISYAVFCLTKQTSQRLVGSVSSIATI